MMVKPMLQPMVKPMVKAMVANECNGEIIGPMASDGCNSAVNQLLPPDTANLPVLETAGQKTSAGHPDKLQICPGVFQFDFHVLPNNLQQFVTLPSPQSSTGWMRHAQCHRWRHPGRCNGATQHAWRVCCPLRRPLR